MRGSPRVSDVELVAREQRRETLTTIRQYMSFEWREQNACAKKFAPIAREREAMECILLKRSVELNRGGFVSLTSGTASKINKGSRPLTAMQSLGTVHNGVRSRLFAIVLQCSFDGNLDDDPSARTRLALESQAPVER